MAGSSGPCLRSQRSSGGLRSKSASETPWLHVYHLRARAQALVKGKFKTSLVPMSTFSVMLTQTQTPSIIIITFLRWFFFSYSLLRAKTHKTPQRARTNLEQQPHLSVVYNNPRGEKKIGREKAQEREKGLNIFSGKLPCPFISCSSKTVMATQFESRWLRLVCFFPQLHPSLQDKSLNLSMQ